MCNCEGKDQVIKLLTASNERKQKHINKLRQEVEELKVQLQNYKQLQRSYLLLAEEQSNRCPKCFERLIWQGDYDMEDIYDDGVKGIISLYRCSDCNIDVEVTEYEEEA